MINEKYLGKEPRYPENHALSDLEYSNALNWYHACCDVEDAREYLVDWLEGYHSTGRLARLRYLPDRRLPLTIAWSVRILNNGYTLPKYTEEPPFLVRFDHFCDAYDDCPKDTISFRASNYEVDSGPKTTIQDRIASKAGALFVEIEEHIDDGDFSAYQFFLDNGVSGAVASRLASRVTPLADEIREALAGKDPQLKEAYHFLTKRALRARLTFLEGVLDDCNRHAGNVRKTRKPRTRKAPSVEKQIKHVKYQPECAEYKLKSLEPASIVGASQLIIFNTRYKTITVLNAQDRGGLSVKGMSVINFDENTSHSYRTGRSAFTILEAILTGGKRAQKVALTSLKIMDRVVNRLGENSVLVRIEK